jgi:FAD/FMN-containing dehydrogenase
MMQDRRVITTMGMVLDDATVQTFKASLRGEVIRPGDDSYDAARKVWNGMIDRRPALIARCAGVADVIRAIQFARAHELLIAVRGGGHNVAGSAVCDGGLVIDLSRLKGIRVDPVRHTARAEGGVTWGEFDHETQVHGLATTGGFVSTTGIAGLTLGGGLGWLMGAYGLACDNLLSVDLVTAEGTLITASATEHEDLFWGVRGGGGNFGVVTSFEYRLYAVGPVLAGLLLYPLAKAREVLRFYRDYLKTAPDELTSMALLRTWPDGTPVVGLALCYPGAIAQGEAVVRALRRRGPPTVDHIGPMAYTRLQAMFDRFAPPGQQNYWRSSFLPELSDDAIDTLVDRFTTVLSPQSMLLLEHPHGAVSRVRPDQTAFSHRGPHFVYNLVSMWSDLAESDKHIAWTRQFWSAMQPFSYRGVYVNYLSQEGKDRVRAAYGVNYERLVALKNKYDPLNVFRFNQNIESTV